MEKVTKKIITPILLMVLASFLLAPTVALASWWNPFSWNWNIFKIFKTQTVAVSTPTTTSFLTQKNTNLQQNSQNNQSIETEKLKKPSPAPIVSVPKLTTPSTTSNNNLQSQTPPPAESWTELENKYFTEANQKGWTTLIITNASREKRYYRKEEGLWIKKDSEAEIQQPYVAPPTLEQLANLRRFCLWDTRLKAICDDPNVMPGYYSNLVFRTKLDSMITNFFATMSDQQKQKIAAEKQTLDCIMAPTPENERLMDPATQNYLRQIRCGTVTEADKTDYELSRIKSSADELKYRLDSKISFPSLYLDPIKTPTLSTPQWQIRWEGSGGTITDSSGNFYQFHCEDNTCRSY
jgi:hypothetical protein